MAGNVNDILIKAILDSTAFDAGTKAVLAELVRVANAVDATNKKSAASQEAANKALGRTAKLTADLQIQQKNYSGALETLQTRLKRTVTGSDEFLRIQKQIATVTAKLNGELLSHTDLLVKSKVAANDYRGAIRILTKTQGEYGAKTDEFLKLGTQITKLESARIASITSEVLATNRALVSVGKYEEALRQLSNLKRRLPKDSQEFARVQVEVANVTAKVSAAIVRQAEVIAHAQATTGQFGNAIDTLTVAQSKFKDKSLESVKLGDRIAALQQKQSKATTALATSFASLSLASGRFDAGIQALQFRLTTLTPNTVEYLHVNEQLVRTYRAQTSAIIGAAKTQKQIGDTAGAVKLLKTEMDKAGEGTSRYTKLQGVMQEMLDGVINRTRQLSAHMTRLGAQWAVSLTLPLQQFAQAAVESFVQVDTFRRSLTAMSGSAETTSKQLERLRELASSPGLTFQTAVQGVVRLEAVGIEAAKAEKIVRAFGNALALTGGTADELANVNIQLSQMVGKGKVLAQDLRPIISAAPAIAKALQSAFGSVDAQVISDQLEATGKSTRDFIDILVREMDRLPRVLPGVRETFLQFSTTLQVSLAKFGDAIASVLVPALNILGPIIEQIAIDFAGLPGVVQGTVVIFGTLIAVAPVVTFVIAQIADSISTLIQVTKDLRELRAFENAFAGLRTSGGAALDVLGSLTRIFSNPEGIKAGAKAVGGAIATLGSEIALVLGPGGVVIGVFAGLAALTYGLHQLFVVISKDVVPATNEQILAQVELIKSTTKTIDAQKELNKQIIEQAKVTGDAAANTKVLAKARELAVQGLVGATEVQKEALKQQVSSVVTTVGNAVRQIRALDAEVQRLGKSGEGALQPITEPGFAQAKAGAQVQTIKELGEALNKTKAQADAAREGLGAYGKQLLDLKSGLGLSTQGFEAWLKINGANELQLKATEEAMRSYLDSLNRVTTATERASKATQLEADALRAMSEAIGSLDLAKMQAALNKELDFLSATAKSPEGAADLVKQQLSFDDSKLSLLVEGIKKGVAARKEIDKLKILGEEPKAAKSGVSVEKKNLQIKIDTLKEELRAIEITNKAKAQLIENEVEAERLDRETAAKQLIQLEQETFQKRQEIFDIEQAARQASKLPDTEKQLAIKKANNDQLEAENEFLLRLEEIRRQAADSQKADYKKANEIMATLANQSQNALVQIEEIGARRRTAIAKRQADLGEITFARAAQIAVNAQQGVFAKRKTQLETQRDSGVLDVTERENVIEQLKVLEQEMIDFELGVDSQLEEGRQTDLDRRRKYNEERIKLAEELTASAIEAAAAQIQAELNTTRDPKRRKDLILQQLKEESKAIEAEYDRRKAAILKSIDDIAKAAQESNQDAQLARIDAEIAANKIIDNERAKADAKQLQNAKQQATVQAGALKGGLTNAIDTLAAGVGSAQQVVEESYLVAVNAATQATLEMLDAWIETGKVGPGAMKKLVHGILKELSKLWLAKGIAELAEGLASLFGFGTQGKAAGHFASAAKFFAAAAVAGVGARATASTQGAGGGSASSAIANTGGLNAAKNPQTETNFSRGVAAGLIGGFQEVINPFLQQQQEAELRFKGMVQVHADKMDQQLDAQIHYTEVLLGVTTPLTTLAGTVEGMSPGDVVGRGAQQNPVAVARGTARGIATDAWERQRLVDNLGV